MWEQAEAEATRVEEQTHANSRRELDLLRLGVSLFAEAFSYSGANSEETGQATARRGLVSQNFNTLTLAINAASRGYYIQSLSLLKNVYENWLAFWYLAIHPEEAVRWLDPSRDQRPPKAETMRNNIDHPSTASKSKLKEQYDELNRFAHTDPIAILDRYKELDGQPFIKVGVEYEATNFSSYTYLLLLWLGQMLDAISVWVPSDHEWHLRHREYSDRILEFIESYNETFGALPID